MCGAVIVFVEGDCLMVSRVAKLLPASLVGCFGARSGFTGSKNATREYDITMFSVTGWNYNFREAYFFWGIFPVLVTFLRLASLLALLLPLFVILLFSFYF